MNVLVLCHCASSTNHKSRTIENNLEGCVSSSRWIRHSLFVIRMRNRTAIRTRVDAIFSNRTEIRITIRFAANRTAIRIGNTIRVEGSLRYNGLLKESKDFFGHPVHCGMQSVE
jgi:hypothetical protein